MTKNLDELLKKAESGTISPIELEWVARRLRDPGERDANSLLNIISLLGDRKYTKLIEPFLTHPTDPFLRGVAIEILCKDWGLFTDYLSQIRQMIAGTPDDAWDEARLPAIAAAGMYLEKTRDKELLKLLVDIIENTSTRQLVRDAAYHAIWRATGRNFFDLFRPNAISENEFYDSLNDVKRMIDQD